MESRRPDDPAIFGINGDQCSPGIQGLAEKSPENLFLVTVVGWMLFPNERIGSYSVKLMKILGPKRPECEKLASQNGLEIKGHFGGWKDTPPEPVLFGWGFVRGFSLSVVAVIIIIIGFEQLQID